MLEPEARVHSGRTDWSGYEITQAMEDRAWAKRDSTEAIWAMARQSGYMAECCRRHLLKHPEDAAPVRPRLVADTKSGASEKESSSEF